MPEAVKSVRKYKRSGGCRCPCLNTVARHDQEIPFRAFGKDTSLRTVELAAGVSFAQGLTAKRVTGETIRATLARMGVGWRRAKHWITSPGRTEVQGKWATERLRLCGPCGTHAQRGRLTQAGRHASRHRGANRRSPRL